MRTRERAARIIVAVGGCLLFIATRGGGASAPPVSPRPVASHATTSAPPAAIAPISFRNQVIPVLTKAGCNSGACHGAAAGKNGFGLTLRGYDPAADYDTITRQAGGRRVNKIEPAKSLILLKPTETVPHMGGTRFKVGLARIRHCLGLDCLRAARASRHRSAAETHRGHADRSDARRRRDDSAARDRTLHRRLDGRRHPLGEVRVGRRDRRACRRRRAGRASRGRERRRSP